MNPKIGIFLDVRPHSGGAFQFSQSVLQAVSNLNGSRWTAVAAYTERLWETYLSNETIASVYIRKGVWGPLACRRISGRLPLAFWRSVCPRFHPISKVVGRLACDLWVFPNQDTWTYLLPVPAMGVIFDLMHRYEPSFPEVSSLGIFESRERHYKSMCRWADGVLVDSETGKRHVMESYHVDPSRVYVLPFVAPRQDLQSEPAGEAPERLPAKFLFYPAQFWEHKNHLRLIEAVALLGKKHPDLNIVFAGSRKNGYAAAVQLVDRLGLSAKVHFLGYVPDAQMAALYRKAHALVMPTFFGPTNIPPLEAMAHGCPVAVSNIYGMPEQLGDAAIYFNPSSVDEIARAMEILWTDDALCRNLSRKGLIRSSQWTIHHFTQKLAGIIESLVQHS